MPNTEPKTYNIFRKYSFFKGKNREVFIKAGVLHHLNKYALVGERFGNVEEV